MAISMPGEIVAPAAAPRVAHRREVIVWTGTVAVVVALYLLLQNPYWVPGGDSEVYIAIARNLATGRGYMFNGQPVSMVPPGWPMVLAAAMKLSSSFLWLKLLTMGCMVGSLAIGYWICRRFASAAMSSAVILLTAILSQVYPLTMWLHSDALFCLLSSAAVLVAMQINENRPHTWRIPLLLALCVAGVFVRWAGIFTWLLVAATLINGRLRPRRDAQWVSVVLSGAVTCATFLSLWYALTVPRDVADRIRQFGGTAEDTGMAIVEKADRNLATAYPWFNPASGGLAGYSGRLISWGNWMSYLLFQPFRAARSHALLGTVGIIVGWTVLVPLLVLAAVALKEGRWLWPALVVYSFALTMNWPQATARYLVPVAFLIILGVFQSFDVFRRRFPTPAGATVCNVVLGYFVAALVLCNGALYAVDAVVAHSRDFYTTYEAGLNKDLIYAAHWLNEHPPLDGEIAVSERYVNLGRTRISRLGLRATSMLTGKAIVSVPMKYTRAGDPRRNPRFLNWARQLGIRYVLYQPDVSPWRVFHFRMGWLQEAMTGQPALDSGAGWRLYEIPPVGDEAIRVSLPAVPNWPRRVPQMQ